MCSSRFMVIYGALSHGKFVNLLKSVRAEKYRFDIETRNALSS